MRLQQKQPNELISFLESLAPEFKKFNLEKDSFTMKGAGDFLIVKIHTSKGTEVKIILQCKEGVYNVYDNRLIKLSAIERTKTIKHLLSLNYKKPEIADILGVSLMTIHRDLRLDAKNKAEG